MMHVLVLDQNATEAVRRVREYAERPENWFRPGPSSGWSELQGSGRRPGDKPEHVVTLALGYRCVFSWTVAEKINTGEPIVVRDLSVSVPGTTPHRFHTFQIAELFGFTKRDPSSDLFLPHPEWSVWLDDCQVPCACLIERIPGANP